MTIVYMHGHVHASNAPDSKHLRGGAVGTPEARVLWVEPDATDAIKEMMQPCLL